jgi:hypothetical protein
MGHTPTYKPDEDRRSAPERVYARPQDPKSNTRPRGNGVRESGETERSTQKLATVLGH